MDEMVDCAFGVAGADHGCYPFAVGVKDGYEQLGRPFEVLAQCQHGVKCIAEVFRLVISIDPHVDLENLAALWMTIDLCAEEIG